jgi:sirohydrochlorin cobaltochelatase
MRGIILFGHGSRDAAWRRPIEAVAAAVQAADASLLVACAYLELDDPRLPQAAAELVARGASELTVVPMFLGTGRHAREDLPLLVQACEAAHPGIPIHLKPSVGDDPRVTALLAKIALE